MRFYRLKPTILLLSGTLFCLLGCAPEASDPYAELTAVVRPATDTEPTAAPLLPTEEPSVLPPTPEPTLQPEDYPAAPDPAEAEAERVGDAYPAPEESEVAAEPDAPTEPPAPTELPQATEPPPSIENAENAEDAETEAEVEPEPILSKEVISGVDQLEIQVTYRAESGSEPRPGVILLHMLNSNRQIWEENGFADILFENGFAVLSVDMRGHGETGGNMDWELAREDLKLVWADFVARPEVDGERTAVIGGSIGSNMALILAADRPEIKTAVLLSPGLDYRGVQTEPALRAYDRNVMIVAMTGDSYAADSSQTLAEIKPDRVELLIEEGNWHGTSMLERFPELEERILEWLVSNM